MDKKFLFSFLLIFVVSMLIRMVNHNMVLSDEYQLTGLYRPEAEAESYFMWMLFAHLLMSFAFVWIYRQGREDRPWAAQGIRFGIIVALLMAAPIYMIYFAVQPMPGMLVFRQIAYDTVGLIIMGLAVAFMYRNA